MSVKKLIAYINAENEMQGNIVRLAQKYNNEGADELYIYNYDTTDAVREEFLAMAREVSRNVDIPFMLGMYVNRFEDVKKALYTGASHIVVREKMMDNPAAIKEATHRFGEDKLYVEIDAEGDFRNVENMEDLRKLGIYGIMLKHVNVSPRLAENMKKSEMTIVIRDSLVRNTLSDLMAFEDIRGVATNYFENKHIMNAKYALKDEGINVETFRSLLDFSDFKVGEDGLIPVIVQDYKTNEVLMMAYMNEEAFNQTIQTGRMTYWSRNRNELWHKGDTSGHYQYLKSLTIDCDNDTLLAKVYQVGAACHTGNRSCFFTTLMKKEYNDTNPVTVFQDVYRVILDRKKNPKEGSYTNYLFDKGLDKILKKCGEEATEIVIAAKNPNAEELKYEISDFLYHMMVLMAECGIDWDDIVKEMANRR